MEAAASLSSSLSVLRHGLRATVCCFVGGSGELAERMRWRRRLGAGDFRYDPFSYALNFDEGDHGVDGDEDHQSRWPPRRRPVVLAAGHAEAGGRRRRVEAA